VKEAIFSKRASFWKAMVAEQRASGLSREKFCEAKKLSRSSLGYWSAKLKRESKSSDDESGFLEILTEPKREPFRVVFKSGAVLHFGVRPEPEFLELLLKLVA